MLNSNIKLKTVLLFNPPGPLYQRGEDRCQANIEESSAVSLREPNDLAYMAAILRQMGILPRIMDYPAEKLSWDKYENDLKKWSPDALIMSVTTATVLDDLYAFELAKKITPSIVAIAKGALFFSSDLKLLLRPQFASMDYALAGEAETIIHDLISALIGQTPLSNIPGIIWKHSDGRWIRNRQKEFEIDLDSIPFPARDLLKNELYIRPDTGAPQATIQTSRGCPSKCIFCLTPAISGQRVRQRSVQNIVDEIEECVSKYAIRDFFFKADTFTINKKFVIELCMEVLNRKLDIRWVANSRVDTIDAERLEWMKKAGCWLVAFGFESGDDEILRKMKKDATAADAVNAVKIVKEAGLRVYGFFMIGLPWDDHVSVEKTIRFAKDLDCDFSEIHIATPYEGTELHAIAKESGLLNDEVIGHDYFHDPTMATLFLSREEIMDYRKKGLRHIYLSPKYVIKTFSNIHSVQEFRRYASYGMRMVKNVVMQTHQRNPG